MGVELKQIDPEHTPERFFIAENTGEGMAYHSNTEHDTDPDIDAGFLKVLKKKVFDGIAALAVRSDKLQIWWKRDQDATPRLIAEADLVGEVWAGGAWQQKTFEFSGAELSRIEDENGVGHYRAVRIEDIPALGVTNAVWGLEVWWQHGNVKFAFYADVPGRQIRIKWRTRFMESALSQKEVIDPDTGEITQESKKGLSWSAADYDGNVNASDLLADAEEGWSAKVWTFEPSGFDCPAADGRTFGQRFTDKAGLWVDPYLSVEDEDSNTKVYCDGYLFEFESYYTVRIKDLDGTQRVYSYIGVKYSGSIYSISDENAADWSFTILENTPERVAIKIKSDFIIPATGVSLSTDASVTSEPELYFYIYKDRMIYYIQWYLSGSVTLDNANENTFCPIAPLVFTNEAFYYENAGSESTGSDWGNYVSADYIFYESDEISVQFIEIYKSLAGGTATYRQGFANRFRVGWNNGTVTAGTTEFIGMLIFDHPDREAGAEIYDSADRLAMGDQYKDAILDQSPASGDDVTDLILPARISSGTLHSDGAHHYDVDSNNELKFDVDTTRNRLAVVVHDPQFLTGAVGSETDHLIEYIQMDDNAASSTITATVGNNGTWEDSSGTGRNTDNDDVSTDIFRGTGLDTGDTYHVDLTTTVYDNDFFKDGSIILNFTPQFGYDDAADQTLWHLYVDSDDYIKIVYDVGNDRYELRIQYGGGGETVLGLTAYTENYSLQKPTTLKASWSYAKDFMCIKVDEDYDWSAIGSGTPSASGASYVHIGAESDGDGTTSLNADVYLDWYKAFDGCILNYGGFYIGNGQGLLADISNPHADLSWFFDGQAAAAKGGTDLGDDDNPTNSGGQFAATDPILGTNVWDSNGASNVLTVADTSEDIIDYNKGFIAGWFKVVSASGGEYLIDVSDADDSDRISAVLDASNNIDVTYKSQGTSETITGDIAVTDGAWFWLKITWDDTGKVHSYINGQENGTAQDIANTWGGGNGLTWYFTEDHDGGNGVDAHIGAIYMGKDPNTPEIWTAFGKPLHQQIADIT